MITRLLERKPKEATEDIVLRIQNGDNSLRDEFIQRNATIIKIVVSGVCKRYIVVSDDEYSIGLIAFNEAIDSYRADREKQFMGFAEMVVKHRVIDHIRKEQRSAQQLHPVDDRRIEEEWSTMRSYEYFKQKSDEEARLEEILAYERFLQEYGMNFKELTLLSPKHRDAREKAIQIAKMVAEDEELKYQVLETKKLPLMKIIQRQRVSKRTLERQRKYIIALVLLFVGDYHYLKEYLPS